MIQALSKLAIPLELILMELTSMFENSFEDAKSLVLKIRTHLFIYTHTHLRPVPKSSQWTREKPSLLSHHVIHVIVGRCQVVSPSWSSCTHKLSESFFPPHSNPFHHLPNILIFGHAHTHHTLHSVSACRPRLLIISILVTLSSQLMPITLLASAFQRHWASGVSLTRK